MASLFKLGMNLDYNGADALVALKFALHQDWIDRVVVGVDSVSQLKALVEIENGLGQIDFPLLGCNDPNLINPSKWICMKIVAIVQARMD